MELALIAFMLAAITVNTLVSVVIQLIVVGMIIWLLLWLVGYVALPEPINKFARGFIVIVGVLFCINALLTLIGQPFIRF